MAKVKPTISVGIPAHNEGNNIGPLLTSILRQRERQFRLEKIFVVCDGCTDNTQSRAEEIAQTDSRVVVLCDHKRRGKAARLNQIYALNTSDYICTFDGDVALERPVELELLLKRMRSNSHFQVVAAHQVPIKPRGIIPLMLYYNSVLWNETRMYINGGDHIANLYGAATMLKRDFAKRCIYPTTITADEEFLYLTAHRERAFAYCYDTHILCYVSESLRELAMQGSRYWNERHGVKKYFGEDAIKAHAIPLYYKLRAVVVMVFRHPVFTIMAILFNVYIHHFPLSDELNAEGQWHQVHSTKRAIKI